MKKDIPFSKDYPRICRISDIKTSGDIYAVKVGYNKPPCGLKQFMRHDAYILHYITSGKGIFAGQCFDNTCGYIVRPNELEMVEADLESPYEAYWIMFKGDYADEILKRCDLPTHNGVFKFDKIKECSEILKEIIYYIVSKIQTFFKLKIKAKKMSKA